MRIAVVNHPGCVADYGKAGFYRLYYKKTLITDSPYVRVDKPKNCGSGQFWFESGRVPHILDKT